MDYQAEKDKTETVTGLSRRTREEIAKWNQITALRLQTGGETSDIPGLPSETGHAVNFLQALGLESMGPFFFSSLSFSKQRPSLTASTSPSSSMGRTGTLLMPSEP